MSNLKLYNLKKDSYSSHNVIARIIGKFPENTKIIDLGCDEGFLGTILLKYKKNYEIEGVDVNKINLKKASLIYKKIYSFDLNSANWPIKKKYDIIVIADTLEHLTNPQKVFKQISRISKKNGIIIISVPNIVFWWSRLLILLGRFPKDNRGIFDKTHLHFFTRKTLGDAILANKNFKINNFYTTTFPLQFILKDDKSYLFRSIYYINYQLSKIWPNLFSYQVILEVQKT